MFEVSSEQWNLPCIEILVSSKHMGEACRALRRGRMGQR